MRTAAGAMLLLAALGLTEPLAGCSDLVATLPAASPAAAPDPSYRQLASSYLKAVFKNYSAYSSFEISDPRWVRSMKGWNWLTCVRFRDNDRVRVYSLFLDGHAIVDGRFAVQTDNCDAQAYSPLEQTSGGLPGRLEPLH